MNESFEFRADVTRLVSYWALLNGLIAVILFVVATKISTALVLVSIVNISYLASVINKPFKLIITQDKSQLEIYYPFDLLRRPKTFPLSAIDCSFNRETLARGAKAKVLKIFTSKGTVVELLPEFNGWNEKVLDKIWESLQEAKKLNDSPSNQA